MRRPEPGQALRMHGVASAPARNRVVDVDPGPPSTDAPVRAARRHVVGTLMVEAMAITILVIGSSALPAGALTTTAAATGLTVLAFRAAFGARRAGVPGLAAWAALAFLQVAVLVPGLDAPAGTTRVVMALVGLGAIPFVSGLVPMVAAHGLFAGSRDDLAPGLLAVAVAGGLGVLAAIGLAGVVGVDDPRVSTLVPYVAAGMAG